MSDHSPIFGRDPRMLAAIDRDGKLLRAIDDVAGARSSDILLIDAGGDGLARSLGELDARVIAVTEAPVPPSPAERRRATRSAGTKAAGVRRSAAATAASTAGGPGGVSATAASTAAEALVGTPRSIPLPDASADVVLGAWTVFRGVDPAELVEVDRLLRPGGRHVVVHDYGRDDVSQLLDRDRPEVTSWSRLGSPFLAAGFKIRVVHCWCTFESLEAAVEVLEATFGTAARPLATSLSRPRLSYNLAIYHRVRAA